MGLFERKKQSACDCVRELQEHATSDKKQAMPNPANFIITETYQIGNYLIAHINYPDATNFEGNKILVYKNATEVQLTAQKEVDPHFCNEKHLSPIARFRPDKTGLATAKRFCASEIEHEKKTK